LDVVPCRQKLVEQLFVRHVAAIRGFIEAFVPDFNQADDVLQECFLTVATKADEFQPGSDFLAWALAIAKFKVLEALRRPGAVGYFSPAVLDTLSAAVPIEAFSDEDREFLRECINELSERARQVIELRYGEACKPAEIARRLNWTREAVYVALSRARALLRECMERKAKHQEHP